MFGIADVPDGSEAEQPRLTLYQWTYAAAPRSLRWPVWVEKGGAGSTECGIESTCEAGPGPVGVAGSVFVSIHKHQEPPESGS